MTWRKYGILIASSRFPDEPKLQPLRCPEHDVEGLNDILKSSEYGQFSDILVLKNKPHHEVLKDINRVLRRAGRDDLVLIYYSGHGKLNAAGRLHLATLDTVVEELDTSSIPVARIKDLVDISSSNKIVLILDCCFSGAVGDAFARSGVDDQLQLVSGGRGTYILTASTGIQVALEKESDEFGVFTKHMIEGISSGKADMDCDGLVSMDDLYRYVHAQVLSEGFQEPMRWNLNVHGPLFIARSGKTSREERACRIRDIIRDLANKSMVPDAIIAKASEVVAIIPAEQTEEQRAYDVLLERLLQQSPDVGDFIQRWYRVPAKSQPPKTRYPVNGPDRSESIKLKIKQILRRRPKLIGISAAVSLLFLIIVGLWLINSQNGGGLSQPSKRLGELHAKLNRAEAEINKRSAIAKNEPNHLVYPKQHREWSKRIDQLNGSVLNLLGESVKLLSVYKPVSAKESKGAVQEAQRLLMRLNQERNRIIRDKDAPDKNSIPKINSLMKKVKGRIAVLEN